MEWKEAFNYGLPTAILAFTFYGILQVVLWGKTAVAEPVIQSHMSLIRALQENLTRNDARLAQHSEQLEALKDAIEVQTKMITDSIDTQTHLMEKRQQRSQVQSDDEISPRPATS